MKKILFVLTVLLLAGPAMAVVNINAVQSGTDPCQVYITYSNTEDSNVRAFALDIWVDDGNIIGIADYNKGECNSTVQGYGIFMGTIVINASGEVTDDGTPIAELADLPSDTQPGLDSNGVTTEMGSLYEAGVVSGPKQTGTLCKLILSKVPCNMTIKANVSRAGVVLENGESSEDAGPPFTTNLPQVVAIAGAGCCPGDTDDDKDIDIDDYTTIMQKLVWANYYRTGYVGDPCFMIYKNDPCALIAALWDNCCDLEPAINGDDDIDIDDYTLIMQKLVWANYYRTGYVGDPCFMIYENDPCALIQALWPCP
jgi:hypothetical protein